MATPYTAERKKRRDELLADPETMSTICVHVANGGTLIDLCETWDLPFGWISKWLRIDPDRNKQYVQALNDRAEWVRERVLAELRHLGLSDLRRLFDDNGRLKDPRNWPSEIAHAIASVEVDELFEGSGKERTHVGYTKKVKLWPKTEALKLIGQNLDLFVERHEISGKVALEDLVTASIDEKKP